VRVYRASRVVSAFPGRLAWQTRPVALVLTLSTPPAVIPTRSNNQLGSELISIGGGESAAACPSALSDAFAD